MLDNVRTKIEDYLVKAREKGHSLNRWAIFDKNGDMLGIPEDTICYARLRCQVFTPKQFYFATVYNGSGGEPLPHTAVETNRADKGGNKRIYDKYSLRWAEFLLSGPWTGIPKFVYGGPDYVNGMGIIMENLPAIPQREFYNWLIAARFCQEFCGQFSRWWYLVNAGVNPATAAWVSCTFQPFVKGFEIKGYGDGHMFLSSQFLRKARRFISHNPRPLQWKDGEEQWSEVIWEGKSISIQDKYSTLEDVVTAVEAAIQKEAVDEQPVRARRWA